MKVVARSYGEGPARWARRKSVVESRMACRRIVSVVSKMARRHDRLGLVAVDTVVRSTLSDVLLMLWRRSATADASVEEERTSRLEVCVQNCHERLGFKLYGVTHEY